MKKSRFSTNIGLYLGTDARAIVTMEGKWEIAPKLSNGTDFNDLE